MARCRSSTWTVARPNRPDLCRFRPDFSGLWPGLYARGLATRFVVELLRNFMVVFIGYSLNDLVMCYMVEALAAA